MLEGGLESSIQDHRRVFRDLIFCRYTMYISLSFGVHCIVSRGSDKSADRVIKPRGGRRGFVREPATSGRTDIVRSSKTKRDPTHGYNLHIL